MRLSFVLAMGLMTVLAAEGCTGPEVILATLPEPDEAATPLRCATTNDCPSGTYCEMPSCDATSGTCEFVPVSCDNEEKPVCGCDGITYLDDCLRKANGVASSTPTQCSFDEARICGGSTGLVCPDGAYCAQLTRGGGGPCPANPEGFCWVLPMQCPPPALGDFQWTSCTSAQSHCMDTCSAIALGGVFQQATRCP